MNTRFAILGALAFFGIMLFSSQTHAQSPGAGEPLDRTQRPAPATHVARLQKLLHIWKINNFIEFKTPAWASEVPEVERTALRKAAAKAVISNSEVIPELVRQAFLLKRQSDTQEAADRLLVLAAKEGADLPEELLRISRSGAETRLRGQAAKLLVLRFAKGRPYEELSSLDIPLPDISSLHGTPVVIVFWAAWDLGFQAQWPKAKTDLDRLAAEGFAVMGINFDPDRERAEAFIAAENIGWPSIFPEGNPFRYVEYYGIRGFPSFWLVDADGRLQATGVCCGVYSKGLSLVQP